MKNEPNKAMEPTPVSVTIPATQEVAPFTSMAHLWRSLGMKPSSISKLLLLALAFSSCERQKVKVSPQASSEPAEQIGQPLEELRKRTHEVFERAAADSSVYDSKEWFEVMDAHGPAYKRQLIECIREAESIAITEHSDRMDFYESNRPLPEHPPFYEYQTVRLKDDDKSAFLGEVEKMDERTEYSANRCLFEPHHRVTIFRRGRETTSISVCFKCDDAIWDQGEFTEPKGLMAALRFVVESAGLKPERDWRALAKARSEQATPSDGDKPSN